MQKRMEIHVSIKKVISEIQKGERMKKQHNINKHLKIRLNIWGAID